MTAPAGHKYIIVLTLPVSGSKFACGGHEGKLALIPIGDGKKEMFLKGVLAFTESKEASAWMKALTKQMTPEEKKNFYGMRPDLALIAINQ